MGGRGKKGPQNRGGAGGGGGIGAPGDGLDAFIGSTEDQVDVTGQSVSQETYARVVLLRGIEPAWDASRIENVKRTDLMANEAMKEMAGTSPKWFSDKDIGLVMYSRMGEVNTTLGVVEPAGFAMLGGRAGIHLNTALVFVPTKGSADTSPVFSGVANRANRDAFQRTVGSNETAYNHAKTIMRHEAAHIVEHRLRERLKARDSAKFPDPAAVRSRDLAHEQFDRRLQDVSKAHAREISKYATNNSQEFFAEASAIYLHPKYSRGVLQAPVQKLMDDVYGTGKGSY